MIRIGSTIRNYLLRKDTAMPSKDPAIELSREARPESVQRNISAHVNAISPAQFTSTELFGAAKEIEIMHRGRRYCLRITQNDKLILNA